MSNDRDSWRRSDNDQKPDGASLQYNKGSSRGGKSVGKRDSFSTKPSPIAGPPSSSLAWRKSPQLSAPITTAIVTSSMEGQERSHAFKHGMGGRDKPSSPPPSAYGFTNVSARLLSPPSSVKGPATGPVSCSFFTTQREPALSDLVVELETYTRQLSRHGHRSLPPTLLKISNHSLQVSSSNKAGVSKAEVSALLQLLSSLPFASLSSDDCATLTRILAKISASSGTGPGTGPQQQQQGDVSGLVIILLLYLQQAAGGAGYKDDASSAKLLRQNSPTRPATGPPLSVNVNLTEVLKTLSAVFPTMQSFAEPLRAAVLEILLSYTASLRKDDSWAGRVAVVDVIRTMLLMPMAPSTSPPLTDSFREGERGNLSLLLGDEVRSSYGRSLEALHDKCLWVVIENMKLSVSALSQIKVGDGLESLHLKLLDSCLRTLTHVAAVSGQGRPPSTRPEMEEDNADEGPSQKPAKSVSYSFATFPAQYQSLVQSAYTLFSRVMPQLLARVDDGSAATSSISECDPASAKQLSECSRPDLVRSTQNIFKFLSALACFNPSSFMSSWSLFLSDSLNLDKQLEHCCVEIVTRTVNLTSSLITANLPSPAPSPVPIFRSVLFSCAGRSSEPSLKATAIDSLRCFLSGLPLRRWFLLSATHATTVSQYQQQQPSLLSSSPFPYIHEGVVSSSSNSNNNNKPSHRATAGFSDKAYKFIMKILHFVVVSIAVERDELVFQRLLELVSVLVMNLPLTRVCEPDLSASVIVGSPTAAAAAYHKRVIVSSADAIPLYEDVSLTLFHSIMTVASSEVCEPTTTDGDSQVGLASEQTSAAGSRPRVAANTRHNAIQWLCGFCKSTQRFDSFVRALNMPYYTGRSALIPSSSSSSSSFIYALTDICLRNTQVIGGNNLLFGLAIRNLNNSLLQLYPELYVSDLTWLSSLIVCMEKHKDKALRLQGCRIMFSLLNKSLSDSKLREKERAAVSHKYPLNLLATSHQDAALSMDIHTVLAAARPLRYTVESLILATLDFDHLVRGQATAAIGLCLPLYWKIFSRTNISSIFDSNIKFNFSAGDSGHKGTDRKHSSAGTNRSTVPTSAENFISLFGKQKIDVFARTLRELIIERLLICAQDSVGTVRAASFKAIGDVIANRGLNIATYGKFGPVDYNKDHVDGENPNLPALDAQIIGCLFDVCMAGCSDSKLAVRIQAAWSIGNLVIAVLPFRIWFVKHSRAGERHREGEVETAGASLWWLSDRFWLQQFRRYFDLLSDSEKVFPTATRALAALICGMDSVQTYPIPASHASSHGLKKDSPLTLESAVDEMLGIYYLKLDCEGRATVSKSGDASTLERVLQYEGEISVRSRRLERSIQDKPQKMVFSIIQSLGSVLWSSCNCEYSRKEFFIFSSPFPSASIGSQLEHEKPSEPESALVKLIEIVDVLVYVLRYGKTKLQLQSAQILLFYVMETHATDFDVRSEHVWPLTAHASLIIRILECAYMAASSLLERSAISSSAAVAAGKSLVEERGALKQADIYKENASRGYKEANNMSKKDSIASNKPLSDSLVVEPTVATLLAGRVKILERYLLVLLLVGFRQLCHIQQWLGALSDPDSDECCAYIQSKSAENLTFHADAFLAWLQIQHSDELAPAFSKEEFSIGLPKLACNFDSKLSIQNKPQQTVVSELCGCILSLLSHSSPSSAPVPSGEPCAFSDEPSAGTMSFFSSDSFLMRPAATAMSMYGSEGAYYSPDAKKSAAHVHSLPRRSLSKICKLAGDAAVDIVGSDMLSELQEPGLYSMFSGGLGLPLSDMHSSMYWRVKEASRDADESSEEEDEI